MSCDQGGCPVRILLIQPPHIGDMVVRPPNFLPLNLGYLASVMVQEGMEVDVLDIWGKGLMFPEVKGFLSSTGYDAYGISALCTQFNYVEKLTRVIKSLPGRPVVIGGALATFSHDEVFSAMSADVCVMGEGERTAVELFPAVISGEDLSQIKGIAFRAGGQTVVTEPRENIQDLDTLPLPSYSLFDMETYIRNCSVYSKYGTYNRLPAINVFTGRGCPYNCHFCSRTILGARYRSVDSVIDEIRLLIRKFGIRGVFFNDEMLVGSKKRVYELCEKIGPLGLKWNCQGRANLMDKDMLENMKSAGCVSVGYGVETGSQAILDAMNKNQTLEDVTRAVNMTVSAGIEPIPQWMVGYPGENEETLSRTRSTFRGFDFPVNPPFICTPLPGTKLYRDAVQEGRIPDKVDFHRNLSDGYATEGKILVNFTSWTDEQLLRRKRELEISVRLDFYRKALFRLSLYRILIREIGLVLGGRLRNIARKSLSIFGNKQGLKPSLPGE